MPTNDASNGFPGQTLRDEFKVMNAHLPRKQRSLTELLKEKHPHVMCKDGRVHFFKRKELEDLSQMLDKTEQDVLLLPIILEVTSDQGGVTIRSKTGTEAKVFSKSLGMPVVCKQGVITIFSPQLSVVRRSLKTTTQYVFLIRNLNQ